MKILIFICFIYAAHTDIAKCLNDAISKLEKAGEKSSNAAEDAVKQMATIQGAGGAHAAALQALLGPLLSQAFGNNQSPTLRSLLAGKPATIVKPSTNLRETGLVMAEARKAALVVDDGELVGIFGFKDMMTRAIAKEIPLELTAVSSVMTENPETATPDISVVEALQIMHDEKMLTLAICEEDGRVLGLVDVMDLIYGCGGAEGWRSIFGSSMDTSDDFSDCDSVSSYEETIRIKPLKKVDPVIRVNVPPKIEKIESRDMDLPIHVSIPNDELSQNDSFNGSTIDEIHSINKTQSRVGFNDGLSSVAMSAIAENQVLFKVVDSAGNNYRVRCECNYERLVGSLATKMGCNMEVDTIELKFTDEEGDMILVRDDECLVEAVKSSQGSGAQATKLTARVLKSEVKDSGGGSNILLIAGAGAIAVLGVVAMVLLKPKK